MGAGDSARSVADRADASAAVHRRKAEAASRRAANFRAGAEGEEALHLLAAGLAQRGWSPMPDRRSPTGGNVDELLVGPTGVAVLDAKAWSHPVRVQGQRIFSGRRGCTRDLDRLLAQVDAVGNALARAGLDAVAVRGFVVLSGPSGCCTCTRGGRSASTSRAQTVTNSAGRTCELARCISIRWETTELSLRPCCGARRARESGSQRRTFPGSRPTGRRPGGQEA